MGFIENIKESFDNISGLEPIFKAVILGENAVYIEGVKDIKSFSTEKIEVVIPKSIIEICGNNLEIRKFCAGDLAICGKIKSLVRI